MNKIPDINITDLLDAGVHFGHKSSRWNPKMAPYIFGEKDNIHIIDLKQTVPLLQLALNQIYNTAKKNGKILFVSSKIQASELISECATKYVQFYVNHRWLGGMLTNWHTISKSIKKLQKIEETINDEEKIAGFTKKETLDLQRKKNKLLRSFEGIRNIGGKPDLIVVIDTNREHLAINEAKSMSIPIIAVVDSNSDPDNVDYPIPGNDDAIRSIKIYCNLFAESALAGLEDALSSSGVDLGAETIIAKKQSKDREIVKSNKLVKAKAVTTSKSNITKAIDVSKAKSNQSSDILADKDKTEKNLSSAQKLPNKKEKTVAIDNKKPEKELALPKK